MLDRVPKEGKVNSRKEYIIIAILSFLIGAIVKILYRNFIYSNKINDLGLSDCLPSILFVVGITNFALFFTSKTEIKNVIKLVLAITVGTLIYEIEQVFYFGIFDIKDILGILFGAVLSIYIFYKVENKKKYQC